MSAPVHPYAANQWALSVSYASAANTRNERGDAGQNSGVAFGTHSYARKSRNGRAPERKELPKPEAFSITQESWQTEASQAYQEHFGDDKHAVKRLANTLECSVRTAENLYLGRTTPSGIHFLRSFAMIPEFEAAVRRLTNKEQSLDPTFERDLADFMTKAGNYFNRRQQGE